MRTFLDILASASVAAATTYRLEVFASEKKYVHGQELNAGALAFFTNITASKYCPSSVGDACPMSEGTLVYDQLSAMAVRSLWLSIW